MTRSRAVEEEMMARSGSVHCDLVTPAQRPNSTLPPLVSLLLNSFMKRQPEEVLLSSTCCGTGGATEEGLKNS